MTISFAIISIVVSQDVPENPVLSTVSNHVFERRLIEKYISETGCDPINGEPLTEEQLIDIKSINNQIRNNYLWLV